MPTPGPRVVQLGTLSVRLSPMTLGALLPVLGDFLLLQGIRAGIIPTAEQVQALVRMVHASGAIAPIEGDLALTVEAVSEAVMRLPFLEALEALGNAFTVITDISIPQAEGEKGAASGEAPGR